MLGVAALLAAGCGPDAAVRAEEDDGGAVVTPGAVDAFKIRVGDCFMDDEAFEGEDPQEITNVAAVPCEDQHVNEVYAIFELPDGDYPGADEVVRLAEEGCVDRFTDFAGVPLEETWLDLTYLFPTHLSWETRDDQEVACAVFDPAGLLEGTLAGAGADYLLPDVGDCMDVEGRVVDCAGEHDSELFLIAELDDGAYPGDRAVEDQAAELCIDAFGDYVGTDYDASPLDFFFFAPDQQTWEAGDRSVLCAVYDPAGPLTGSVSTRG